MSDKKITEDGMKNLVDIFLNDKTSLNEALGTKSSLGDHYLEDYGKAQSKMPREYVQIFSNAGILRGSSIEERVKALENFTDNIIKGNENQYSVEENIGNIFIVDLLGSLAESVRGAGITKLQEAGGLMEGFVALLFSGVKIGQKGGFADVKSTLGNSQQLISVKFMAPTSSNYQAVKTVSDHFNNSDEPILFFNVVKTKISKIEQNQFKIFLNAFTKKDWEDVVTMISNNPDESRWQNDIALVTSKGEKYSLKNPKQMQYTADAGQEELPLGSQDIKAKPTSGTWETKEPEGRITFLDYGKLVATINLPSLESLKEKQVDYLRGLGTKIVEITQSLKELQTFAVEFSSTAKGTESKANSAIKVKSKFNEARGYLIEELEQQDSSMEKLEESKKVTAEDLKKLFDENFKK